MIIIGISHPFRCLPDIFLLFSIVNVITEPVILVRNESTFVTIVGPALSTNVKTDPGCLCEY